MSATLDAATLHKAADIIEARGLCQGAYVDDTGAVCILGALALARGLDLGNGVDRDDMVEKPLSELAVLMRCDPVVFSDDEGRTAREVANALRAAVRPADAPAVSAATHPASPPLSGLHANESERR